MTKNGGANRGRALKSTLVAAIEAPILPVSIQLGTMHGFKQPPILVASWVKKQRPDMTDARKRTRDWRGVLTEDEQDALQPIEEEMSELRERLFLLSARYHRIQNRASVRAGKAPLSPPRKRKAKP